jgi:hypothetical protein
MLSLEMKKMDKNSHIKRDKQTRATYIVSWLHVFIQGKFLFFFGSKIQGKTLISFD